MVILKNGKYFLNVSQEAKKMPVSHYFLVMINPGKLITSPGNMYVNIHHMNLIGGQWGCSLTVLGIVGWEWEGEVERRWLSHPVEEEALEVSS